MDCWSWEGPRSAFDGWMECRDRNGGIDRLEQDGLVWPTRPHHDSGFPDSRFWVSEFRNSYGIWGIMEYRTMRSWGAGAEAVVKDSFTTGPRGGGRTPDVQYQ